MYIRVNKNTIINVEVVKGEPLDLDIYAIDNPNYIEVNSWEEFMDKIKDLTTDESRQKPNK